MLPYNEAKRKCFLTGNALNSKQELFSSFIWLAVFSLLAKNDCTSHLPQALSICLYFSTQVDRRNNKSGKDRTQATACTHAVFFSVTAITLQTSITQVYEVHLPWSSKREGFHSKVLDKFLIAKSKNLNIKSIPSRKCSFFILKLRCSNNAIPEKENC